MISACFIIKNEEKWLDQCLKNVKPIVSEIIIVDTGSTDMSKTIAMKNGARVFDFHWTGDFSAARNFSISHSTQDWILNFDADERLATADLPKILELIKNATVDAYSFKIRNYAPNSNQTFFVPCSGQYPEFEAGHVGYFETQRIKLFRNRKGIHFVGAVHELVESTVQGKVETVEIPVHHFGELPDEKTRKQKQSTYFPIVFEKAQQNPMDWKAQFELGAEYVALKDFEDATKCFEKALSLAAYASIYSHLGHCYFTIGRLEEADKTYKLGMSLYPNDHDIRFNFATMKVAEGKFQEAIHLLEPLTIIHPESYLAYRAIGYSYLNLEKLSEAQVYLEKALALFPKYEDALVDLGILRFFQGRKSDAMAKAQRALDLFPNSPRAGGLLKAMATHS